MATLTCKSCGSQFEGNYCNHCGEKVIREEDRKLKRFFGELFNAFTFADNKLWRTLKMMLISPGLFSKNFVEGRRVSYMKPISLFFLANLIYFLFPLVNTFTTNLSIQVNDAFVHSEIASGWVQEEIAERDMTFEEYEFLYDTKTAELSKLLLILMVLLMALFFWLIHIGSKRNLLADHLTTSLELMSFILFYCIQLYSLILLLMITISPVDLQFLFSNFYLTFFIVIFLAFFFIHLERTFYEFGWVRSIVNVILCIGAFTLSLQLYRGLLFFITFWSV